MSLILDALARAEKEKSGVPTSAASSLFQDGESVAHPSQRAPWAVAALALAVGAALAWAALQFLDDGPPKPSDDEQNNAIEGAAVTAQAATPSTPKSGSRRVSPVAETVPSPLPVRPGPEFSPSVATPTKEASPPTKRVVALYAANDETVADGEPVAASGRLSREETSPPSVEDVPVIETPVDLDAVLREVREEARGDAPQPHPAPLLADLSQQFRNRVPSLMYLRHDYNPRSTSTVLLNGETLRAGQRTRGVEVVEVLSDSLVLRFDGTEFRLRALNSWVNL